MKKKDAKINPVLIGVGIAIMLVFLYSAITSIKFWGAKSIHEDAKKYQTNSCLIYYPDSSIGKTVAKSICKNDKTSNIYDYILIPYGDYYLVRYGNGTQYFTDTNFEEIKLNPISEDGKQILSDYLRYTAKQDYSDKYYSSKFMEESYYENLDINNIVTTINEDNVLFRFNDFDMDVNIPFIDAQKILKMNFGYDDDAYTKPTYVDMKKPYICLTFEGGPSYGDDNSTQKIIDILSKYDANATFFVVGNRLENNEDSLAQIEESIARGNEYGSATQNYSYIPNLETKEEIVNEVYGPINFFKNNLNYTMHIYRPPGGLMTNESDEAIKLPAICWGLDSNDWLDVSVDDVVERVINGSYEGRIVNLHDYYNDTALAIEEIVPALLDKGYQLITISDALAIERMDYNFTVWYGY